jgi:DNA-binding NarL/FixJ family response regulator
VTQVLIADDHPLFRNALAQAVRGLGAGTVVHEAGSLAAALAALAAHPDIDLVLLDLHMPDSHGLMGLATLRAEHPSVAVAMISAQDDPAVIRRALAYGAAGYIPKRSDSDVLLRALRALLDCEEYVPPDLREAVRNATPAVNDSTTAALLARLTPQQFKVLTRVAEGQLNKQIADALGISERTVKAHLSALFEKLEVRNRTQAGVLLRSLQLSEGGAAWPEAGGEA